MADPFEVRMRFSNQLQHLNASQVSAQKAAQFALKYREMSEDLHSCILEQLERNSMNTRANIMYFIEPFLELAQKESCKDYIRRMERDIIRVVDAVCPEDGSGAANIKVARKVLQGLALKSFLTDQTVAEIEECLRDRAAISHSDMGLSSPVNGDATMTNGTMTGSEVNGSSKGGSKVKLEKRQIEQRIEEDRERHKKRRENMWVTPRDPQAKRDAYWEAASDLGSDDDRMAFEDEQEIVALTGTGEGQAERRREQLEKEAAAAAGTSHQHANKDPLGNVRTNGMGGGHESEGFGSRR